MDTSNEAIAEHRIERFEAIPDSDLPLHKTGIAHLTCGLINTKSREDYTETLKLIPQSELDRLFLKASYTRRQKHDKHSFR